MYSRFKNLLQRLRAGSIELDVRRYRRMLARIEKAAVDLPKFPDQRLQSMATELKQQVSQGVAIDQLIAESFALVRESASRILGMRPFDEQMMAGIALHQGKVVQMETGEGKTLAAVAPVFLNGLLSRGVHVLTYDDYLAHRDSDWMGPLYRFLGLRVGYIQQSMPHQSRRDAYACDITYVTATEAGFDYLRDQICMNLEDRVQRGFHFAIIDEADSILIDEARVPLVIAGDVRDEPVDLRVLADAMRQLQRGQHYDTDDRQRNAHFTSQGLDFLEAKFACDSLHSEHNAPILTRLNLALQAEALLHRDVDYLVRNEEVLLLDDFTGRVAENRRWPFGLQAAVEAKENQPIQSDGKILNSITLQHYVKFYQKLAGMTGTAEAAAEEFGDSYQLKVAIMPPHKPCQRVDHPDLIFASKDAKEFAVLDLVKNVHAKGQPVLVGTSTVKESETLTRKLREAGIGCQVLNAKNDEQEAAIIAEAGALGAVTISTNMAGRGTDIKLGGHDERDHDRVVASGGLFVIGTNRHESRRIDDQLRGRAGRQGDPGCSRFLVSVRDDLLERFGASEIFTAEVAFDSFEPITDRNAAEQIAHVQRVIEGECHEVRATLQRYSMIQENQRKIIAKRRDRILIEQESPGLIEMHALDKFNSLGEQFGSELLDRVVRQIAVAQINRCWSDHLAHLAEIKDSIFLFGLSGFNPLNEYQSQAAKAFREMQNEIDQAIVSTFESATVTRAGIDLEHEGLLGPSSTWTYMINDNPAGSILEQVNRAIRRRLKRSD